MKHITSFLVAIALITGIWGLENIPYASSNASRSDKAITFYNSNNVLRINIPQSEFHLVSMDWDQFRCFGTNSEFTSLQHLQYSGILKFNLPNQVTIVLKGHYEISLLKTNREASFILRRLH